VPPDEFAHAAGTGHACQSSTFHLLHKFSYSHSSQLIPCLLQGLFAEADRMYSRLPDGSAPASATQAALLLLRLAEALPQVLGMEALAADMLLRQQEVCCPPQACCTARDASVTGFYHDEKSWAARLHVDKSTPVRWSHVWEIARLDIHRNGVQALSPTPSCAVQ